MASKLFEIVEHLMIDAYFYTINPIWENWINSYNFYFAGKSDN